MTFDEVLRGIQGQAGVLGLLLFIIFAGAKTWWEFKWSVDKREAITAAAHEKEIEVWKERFSDSKRREEEWKGLALEGRSLAETLIKHVETGDGRQTG